MKIKKCKLCGMNLYRITGIVTYSNDIIIDGTQIYNHHVVAENKEQAKKRFSTAIKASFPLSDRISINIEKCECIIKGVK